MIYSSLSGDSIVFARWQGREAPGPHTSFLLPSGSSCLHLDRWSQSSGLALVHPVRWWGWGHFAYLSLENSQSVLWAQLVQKSFLQTHPTSIFSDATVSSPYSLRMPVIPNLKHFRVTSSLLCGTFAISNIIFSYPSWDRQKPLNFFCATRKALGNWCSHYLTVLGCHFHFVASFIVGALCGDIFPELWMGSGWGFSTFGFLLDSLLSDTSRSDLMVWGGVVVIPSTYASDNLLPLPLFSFK